MWGTSGGVAWVAAMVLVGAAAGAAGAQEPSPVGVVEFGGHTMTGPGQLHEGGRVTVAVDRDGNVWVADAANDRVVKYDYNGTFIAAFPRPRGVGVGFQDPWDIAADNRGNIFVLDERGFGTADHSIVVINTSGRRVRTFAVPATAAGLLANPEGIATDARGRVYVADTPHRRIVVMSAAGGVLRQIMVGFQPTHLDVSGTEIYVSDNAGTLHRLADNGTELNTLPLNGGVSRGIAVFGTHVYVADANQLRRHVRDLGTWRFLTDEGLEPFQTNEPTGVAVDCRGNVYVADSSAYDPREDGTAGPSKVIKLSPPSAVLPPPCRPVAPPTVPVDTQVNDIEVTQGTQWIRDYTASDAPTGPRTRAYSPDPTVEVPMRVGGRTVVRVYASLRSGDEGGVSGVPATLSARTGSGRELGPIAPDAGPAVLRVEDTQTALPERADPAGAYTFTLPKEWTESRSLDLTARVNPAGIGCDDACARRSTFVLSGVPFRAPTRSCSISQGGGRPRPACDSFVGVDVKTVALLFNGDYPQLPEDSTQVLTEPGRVFAAARAVTPVELLVGPWYRTIEIGDIAGLIREKVESCFLGIEAGLTCSDEEIEIDPADQGASRDWVEGKLMDRIDQLKENNRIGDATILLGLRGGPHRNDALLPGAMRGKFLEQQDPEHGARGYADIDRPLGTIAHELQHALGRRHAGGNPSCYPPDQLGELWPDPTNAGSLLGIGVDTRSGSGGGRGPYALIVPGFNGYGTVLRDLMSYCAPVGEGDMWISPLGWNKLITYRPPVQARRAVVARAAQATRLLRVSAVQLADGSLRIAGSRPDRGSAPAADPAATHVLEARGADAAVLAASPATVETTESGTTLVTGAVALPTGATQVTVRRGTEAVTRVTRSPNAPTVRLDAPRSGRMRGATVALRWRAADADSVLGEATVEYSRNGGRTWETMWVGSAAGGAVRLPMSTFAPSRNARLRVRVDDGFREDVAESGRLRVDGAPPLARITGPASGLTVRADAPLLLDGEGFASGGGRLGERALHWFDGRRRIGRGTQVSVAGLSPGNHTLRLVAVAGGRRGTASVRITVLPVAPAFLRLDAPASVGSRARAVVLRVASTVAAQLRVGGKSFPVDRKPRRVRVPIRRGTTPLALTLTLRAGGKTTTQALSIARG